MPRELVYSCRHYRREMRGVPRPSRHLRVGCRHRPGAPRGRPLRRARGQPAGAERRVLHARQPRGHQARLPGPVQPLQRPADRALRPGAAGHAAGAGAAGPPGPDHRRADARRRQLRLLRARLPRARDGHPAGRGARPARPRQRSSTCGRRRGCGASTSSTGAWTTTSSIRWRSEPTRTSASPACSTPIAPATCRSPTRSAPASPTTRRSTPTCRRSSASTSPRSRSSRTSRPTCCGNPSDRQYVLEHLDSLVVKAVGESGGYGMLIGPHSTAARARGVPRPDPGRPAQLHRPADAGAVARGLLRRRAASSRATSTCGPTSSTATRSRSCPAG